MSAEAIAEAAVVGYPRIKGQGVYAYLVLQAGADDSPDSKRRSTASATQIGAHAKIDRFQVFPVFPDPVQQGDAPHPADARRDLSRLGDTSTLADPSVVDAIIAGAGLALTGCRGGSAL